MKQLPKMDEILLALEKKGALVTDGRDYIVAASRAVIGDLREAILAPAGKVAKIPSLEAMVGRVEERLAGMHRVRLRKVVNATGLERFFKFGVLLRLGVGHPFQDVGR